MNYLFLATGFEEIEALATVDILRRAGMDMKTMSITDQREVEGTHGVMVAADLALDVDLLARTDGFLILPGGMPGALNLRNCEPLCAALVAHNLKNAPIAAICASPYVLGELGILQGKTATCYPGFEEKLSGAVCKDTLVECSGNVITGKGPAASLDFAFAIVGVVKGQAVVRTLREAMMFD